MVRINRDKNLNHLRVTDATKIPSYQSRNDVGDEPGMEGDIIFERSTGSFCFHDGLTWVCVDAAAIQAAEDAECTATPGVTTSPFPVLENVFSTWTENIVSGTSTEVNGTIIEAYLVYNGNNGPETQFLASAIVFGGVWTIYVGGSGTNVTFPRIHLPSLQPISSFIAFPDLYVYARAPCKTTSPPRIVAGGVRVEFGAVECFTCEARVATPNGMHTIDNINVGDAVMGYNTNTDTAESDIVSRVAQVQHDKLVTLSFDDDTQITSTRDHPYYVVGKGWSSFAPSHTQQMYPRYKNVEEISVNDLFLTVDGHKKLIDVTEKDGAEMTYTLELENNDAFIVEGVVVGVELGA